MANYTLRLYDPFGAFLIEIDDFLSLEYVLAVNTVGTLTATLSPEYDGLLFSSADVQVDNRLEIWRQIPGGQPYLEGQCQWLIRRAQQIESGGQSLTRLQALHANHLLTRRIVAYAAGSAQADKSASFADNRMKDVTDENFLASATDANRQITAYLQNQADQSAGASISKAFSRRNVLTVLQEYAQASALAGTYLAFDTLAVSPSLFEFRTYTGQRGVDRRYPGGSDPALIGPEYGNVADATLDFDHTAEATYVYAGGQGEEAARVVGTASDATRIAASPLGRIEQFVDARMTDDATQLADEAEAALRAARPRQIFSAKLVETPNAIYGLQYGFGDYLTIQFRGRVIDCRLDVVHVTVSEGMETLDINLRAEQIA